MKSLRVFAVFFVIIIFSAVNIYSQAPERDVIQKSLTLPFSCIGQDLTGTLTVELTYFNNHIQSRIFGTMTGTDELEYDVEMINNRSYEPDWGKWGQQAQTFTWPGNYHISRDGKLIGVVFFAYHYTFNANGLLCVERGNEYEYSCKGEGRVK